MTAVLDPTCSKAVDEARLAAIAEVGADAVGDHVEVAADDDRVVTHLFECRDPAYVGWRWAVTVARPPRARTVTIDEVVLVAGPESIIAPPWVPFGERILPGDLSVGDVLPSTADDERLVPGFTASGDTEFELEPPLWEPGLGRLRVMSPLGREYAAERWESSDTGPGSPMARSAAEPCSTCGFLLPMAGPLGKAFGVCGNAYSPSDGGVVSMSYGCGAHSESVAETAIATIDIVIDDLGYDDLGSHVDAEPEAAEATEAEATEAEATEAAEAAADAAEAAVDAEPPLAETPADHVENQPAESADTEESP